MKAQSLSIVVPGNKCINKCKFCCSKTHFNLYPNRILIEKPGEFVHNVAIKQYEQRLQYVKDNQCDTVVFTGIIEPLQNPDFLNWFTTKFHDLFHRLELQTTGILLNQHSIENIRDLWNISTISLSVSDLFENKNNNAIIQSPEFIDLDKICALIKQNHLNLRLSVNLLKCNYYSPARIFQRAKQLGADQITFRKMYISNHDTELDHWIEDNAMGPDLIYGDGEIVSYVKSRGHKSYQLSFGASVYVVNDISVVIDDDCMALGARDSIKYFILRENCKLYSHWDTPGSLIF